MERICTICGEDKKNTHYVVTLKCRLVCWPCVAEAVELYKDAMEETK